MVFLLSMTLSLGGRGERPVRPPGVVVVPEPVELGLELGDLRRGRLPGEPALLGLVEALDLAAGLRVVGVARAPRN
jgi:hypothetical protein